MRKENNDKFEHYKVITGKLSNGMRTPVRAMSMTTKKVWRTLWSTFFLREQKSEGHTT